MVKFAVTYEIVTEESAENGEAAESGFLEENVRLGEAIDLMMSLPSGVASIEASDSRVTEARWITAYGSQAWEDGSYENRSLHIPDTVTASSRRRIARLIDIKGA